MPGLTPGRALREAAGSVRAHVITTVLLVLITGAMTATIFLTVGRTAATEQQVLASIDDAGPRLIEVIVEEPSPGVPPALTALMADLPEVEWVLGLGPVRDVRAGETGRRPHVGARDIVTDLPPLAIIEEGRPPQAGEALVSSRTQEQLRLVRPSGPILDAGRTRAVVGRFSSSGVLGELERLVIVQPGGEPTPATLLYVLAEDTRYVEGIAAQLRVLSGVDPELLSIRTSEDLVELQSVLSGQVGALSRQLALGAVAVGLVLELLTVTMALSTRRRDFGRRRALGSTRSGLIALVTLEVALPVVAGAVLGTVAGAGAVAWWNGSLPGVAFLAAVPLLVVTIGTLTAIPPALLSAYRDPVSILRIP